MTDELPKRNFQVHACLGRGGFGEVYRATMYSAGGIDTEVAIKVLRADLDPRGQAVQRLRDEGRLLARLNHPTILRVHDLVVLEGRISMVTEYIEGEDLEQCFEGDEPIPLRALLEAISGVAGALDAAWNAPSDDGGQLQLVHRDIKPSNIRVSRHGEVKLLDFGIARTDAVEREARTQTDMMVGSPAYMAPERFLENKVQPKSDVFALGSTLYEGITHKRLFEDLSVPMMASLALDESRYQEFLFQRLDALPEVPQRVIDLLVEVLMHDIVERPGHAELARRCEELADEVGGKSLSVWCRGRTWPTVVPVDGVLEGRTLTEGTLAADRPANSQPIVTTMLEAPQPATESGASVRPAALGGVLLGGTALAVSVGVGILVVAVVAAFGMGWIGPSAELLPGPAPAPVAVAPSPEPAPAPITAPVPKTKKKARPSPRPKGDKAKKTVITASAPEPEPEPAPAPAPAPKPSVPTVSVAATGDVPARLTGSAGTFALPGEVPVGSYEVQAAFDGRTMKKVGSLTVVKDGAHRVTCSSSMMRCGIK